MSPSGPTTSVVVACASALHRDALSSVLEASLRVLGTAGGEARAVELVASTRPDVAVARMGRTEDGAAICAALKARELGTRVLVMGPDDGTSALVEAVHAGADGYHREGAGVDALVQSIEEVAAGHASIPGEMLGGLLRSLISHQREEDSALDRFGRLSNREREILALLVDGLDNDAIAKQLVVSPNTARTHVSNILRKLEVHSRLEAASLVTTFELLERFPPAPDQERTS